MFYLEKFQKINIYHLENFFIFIIKVKSRRRFFGSGKNIAIFISRFFFPTGKSRLRVIPFIYFISCLFIVYYSIPEVSSIGIQVYWAGIPEVSSARNFRQTGIPEVSSRVKKSRLNKFLFIYIKRHVRTMTGGPPNIIIVYIEDILFFIKREKTSFY